jgi:putative transferase (TIGR04331 family)
MKKKYFFENYFCRSFYGTQQNTFGNFKHPWLNSAKRLKDIKRSLIFKKIVKEELIKKLNFIHSENYGESYWKFIINPFLEKIITTLYETECIFNKIKRNYKNILEFECPKLNFNKINVDNYYEFTKTLDTKDIKFWVTSLFYSYDIQKKNKIIRVQKKNYNKPIEKKLLNNKQIIVTIYNKLALIFFKKFYLTEKKSLRNFFMILIRYKLIPFFITEKFNFIRHSEKLRKKLILKIPNKKFEFILNKIIPVLFPKSYLENYKNIKDICEKNKFLKNQIFFDDGVLVNSDFAKVLIAHAKSNYLIKFNLMQHGGGYNSRLNSYVLMENDLSDTHYTWGKPVYPNQKQFLSPQIKNFFNINTLKSKKIILPLSLPALFAKNMVTSISGKMYENYFLDILIFLDNLEFNIRKNIILRFQPGAKILNYDKVIQSKFPEIEIDYGYDTFKKHLKNCKISVCSVNSTTLLQSIASGIPTLFFWRNHYYESRSFLRDDLLFFKKNFFFYNCPVKASKFLNANFKKINIIWNELKKEKKFKLFLNNNCNL